MTVREPVLVIAFNRPDHLRVLLDRLREVGVENIYVSIDGPRDERDTAAVTQCQELVRGIDWTPNVTHVFRERNLGCGRGVSAAISWFFDQVDRGIIVEDDVIPVASFFPFCTELLDRYEDDSRVFAVSGCNPVPPEGLSDPEASYRFAQITHVWGWATWRRAWSQFSLGLDDWYRQLPAPRWWDAMGRSIPGVLFWAGNFEAVRRSDVDTWDWPMNFTSMKTGQLTATSNVNLVNNIGFGPHATHTHSGSAELMPVGEARTPSTPVPIQVDRKAERWTMRHHWNATYLGTLDRLRKLANKGRGAA